MTTGCHLSDTPSYERNHAEELRDNVILAAVNHRLLNSGRYAFTLDVQRDALTFFVRNAPRLPELSCAGLIALAKLRRDHPTDWKERASESFLTHSRTMRRTRLNVTIKVSRRQQAKWINKIFNDRFENQIRHIPDQSIDLVVTSPPYAMQRREAYGGISEAHYPTWTVGWMREMKRILKPRGSVVIVIGPHVVDGAESPYVLQMRLALLSDGWVENGVWPWVKPDAPALGRVDRPRQAWEPIHWYSLGGDPYCEPKAPGEFSARLGLINKKGANKHIHHKISAELEAGIARISNVFSVPLSTNDRSRGNYHPAQYPVGLVEPLVRMLSPRGGVVLDPFMGSGTTAIAALRAGRLFVGFEKEIHYAELARARVNRFRREGRNVTDRVPLKKTVKVKVEVIPFPTKPEAAVTRAQKAAIPSSRVAAKPELDSEGRQRITPEQWKAAMRIVGGNPNKITPTVLDQAIAEMQAQSA